MAVGMADGARQFADLARNLRAVGEDGVRRELYRAIDDAAQPLVDTIGSTSHLQEYMPNRYAGVLAASLKITTSKRTTGEDAGVNILIRAPTLGRGGRKVRQRNEGRITHSLFGNKRHWFVQTAGMVPRFADDPVERAAPQVREKVAEAVRRITEQATGR
jgi:hypothetical protein